MNKSVDMGFAKKPFPFGTHICLVYSDEKERRKIIGKYLTSGILANECVAYFADVMKKDEVLEWLADFDVDVPSTGSNDSFSVHDAVETYCPDGIFDVDGMLGRLKQFHDSSASQGYACCRVSGEMSWALRGLPGSENLMLYESRVNDVFLTHPVTAICQYDANLFDGHTIMGALKVHPMMIVRDQIVHNPYYLKADEFVEEFNQRKAMEQQI